MAAWMLVEILKDPLLHARVVQSIADVQNARGQGVSREHLDADNVLRLPLLHAIYTECMRLRVLDPGHQSSHRNRRLHTPTG